MKGIDMEDDFKMNFQRVEVVRNINRFESSIKHKPNVFSVVVQNSNLAKDPTVDMTSSDDKLSEDMSNRRLLEKYKESFLKVPFPLCSNCN